MVKNYHWKPIIYLKKKVQSLGAYCLSSGTDLWNPECFFEDGSPCSQFKFSSCSLIACMEWRNCIVSQVLHCKLSSRRNISACCFQSLCLGLWRFTKLSTLDATSANWFRSTSDCFMGVQSQIWMRRDTTNTLLVLKLHWRRKKTW